DTGVTLHPGADGGDLRESDLDGERAATERLDELAGDGLRLGEIAVLDRDRERDAVGALGLDDVVDEDPALRDRLEEPSLQADRGGQSAKRDAAELRLERGTDDGD